MIDVSWLDWGKAPEWAVDVRNAEGNYGYGLIFTNDDKRYCEVDIHCGGDYKLGFKDHIGVIDNAKILCRRPS